METSAMAASDMEDLQPVASTLTLPPDQLEGEAQPSAVTGEEQTVMAQQKEHVIDDAPSQEAEYLTTGIPENSSVQEPYPAENRPANHPEEYLLAGSLPSSPPTLPSNGNAETAEPPGTPGNAQSDAQGSEIRRRILEILAGLFCSAILVFICYLPFASNGGLQTSYQVLLDRSKLTTTSIARLAVIWLRDHSRLAGDPVQDEVRRTLTLLFAVLCLPQLWRAARGFTHLIGASYGILLTYLLIAAFWFQPWYLIWIIALAAVWPGLGRQDEPLMPSDSMLPARTTLYSLCAMLTYVIFYWSGNHGNRINEWEIQSWSFIIAHVPVILLTLIQLPTLWRAAALRLGL